MSWIAVARSDDVPSAMAMPACIKTTDLAIWRSATGAIHAWGDRCPHRGMRLSHGFVRGETLACIYHGWQYRGDGSCAAIPAHPQLTPPVTICATRYACAESTGLIWVALDQPDTPPPALPGLRAIRSLPVACAAETVAGHFNQSSTAAPLDVPASDLTLILQPQRADHCMIHALAPAGSDPKAVSAQCEALRDTIEEVRA